MVGILLQSITINIISLKNFKQSNCINKNKSLNLEFISVNTSVLAELTPKLHPDLKYPKKKKKLLRKVSIRAQNLRVLAG